MGGVNGEGGWEDRIGERICGKTLSIGNSKYGSLLL